MINLMKISVNVENYLFSTPDKVTFFSISLLQENMRALDRNF